MAIMAIKRTSYHSKRPAPQPPHILTTTMSTVPQSTSQDPPHHGINDGSGEACGSHSYALVDEEGKVVSRDESLTEILISKGVKEANFISAIVSLGEGRYFLCLGCFNFEQFQMRFAHMM